MAAAAAMSHQPRLPDQSGIPLSESMGQGALGREPRRHYAPGRHRPQAAHRTGASNVCEAVRADVTAARPPVALATSVGWRRGRRVASCGAPIPAPDTGPREPPPWRHPRPSGRAAGRPGRVPEKEGRQMAPKPVTSRGALPLALSAALAWSALPGGAAEAVEFDGADIFLELNATDGDVGVHVFLDAESWRELRIQGPGGQRIVEVTPRGNLA